MVAKHDAGHGRGKQIACLDKQEPGRASQKHIATAYMPSFCSVVQHMLYVFREGCSCTLSLHASPSPFSTRCVAASPIWAISERSGCPWPTCILLTVLPLIPPALRLHIDDSLRAPSCPFIQESSNEAKQAYPF